MTADGWRDLIFEAIDRDDHGDHELLNLLVHLLTEQDCAKNDLRAAGFGCTGMPWPDVVREIIQRDEAAHR